MTVFITLIDQLPVIAAEERKTSLIVFWSVIIVIGVAGVVLGAVLLVKRWGATSGMNIEVGPIKAGNVGLGIFVGVLALAAAAAGVGNLATELGKNGPTRCGTTGVAGAVDEAQSNRQPLEGTACVNSDAVATFFDGEMRVALTGMRAHRIGAGVLEITGDSTPIQTECPFNWPNGLGAGDSARVNYFPAPAYAKRENAREWTLHIESVGVHSARVFVTRSESQMRAKDLRELERARGKAAGPSNLDCASTGTTQVDYPGRG
jgi:hypothetical protein